MKEKTKNILRDPRFIRLCVFLALLIAFAVAAIIIHGKPQLVYVLQGIYVVYAVILFFFIKTLVQLYIKYFRQKKAKRESRIKKKLKAIFNSADEKLRKFFNLKPRNAFFGGDDTEYSAQSASGGRKREKASDRRIKWGDLNENKQKIRYLFAARVSEGIADGADISSSDTARQIEKKISKTERDKVLFSLYESIRYTNRNEIIDDGTVSYLSEKQTAQRKKKK